MTTATLLAYVVAGVALVSAAGVVLSARTIYSALCLVGNMVSLAVLFLLLNAQFVAAIGAVYLTRRLPHAPGPPVERTAPVAALPEESAPDAGRETVAVG